jgi:hypothetical protein
MKRSETVKNVNANGHENGHETVSNSERLGTVNG